MNKKIIIGALVICLLAFVAVFAFSQSSTNIRWEYTTFQSNDGYGNMTKEDLERANQLGREGWELVTASMNHNKQIIYIFKRRLP